ncbi:MAG: ribosome maturation factor RimP [Spirochaetales bacterium]|nr:ribosome maturation factor RimP [Spirochaetales bacterium]
MERLDKSLEIFKVVAPVVEGLGFNIVDLSLRHASGVKMISLVVISSNGVTIDDCSNISRALFVELELLYGRDQFSLEVSSPGLTRKIRHSDEFSFFIGSSVRVVLDGGDTVEGEIIEVADSGISICGFEDKISFADIKKAKLIYSTKGGR